MVGCKGSGDPWAWLGHISDNREKVRTIPSIRGHALHHMNPLTVYSHPDAGTVLLVSGARIKEVLTYLGDISVQPKRLNKNLLVR